VKGGLLHHFPCVQGLCPPNVCAIDVGCGVCLLPPPAETCHRRCWPMRELMNAIFFVLRRGGCPLRVLPEHFPPHQTAYRWFTRFLDDGTREILNDHLVILDRERVGRKVSPSAAFIDSQSVKTTEAVAPGGMMRGRRSTGGHSSRGCSPTGSMSPNAWRTRPGSSSRSCASRPFRSALPSIPDPGSSNASSRGAIVAWPRGNSRIGNGLPL
jgi:transposase